MELVEKALAHARNLKSIEMRSNNPHDIPVLSAAEQFLHDLIPFLEQKLVWKGEKGGPGNDISAFPNQFMTYKIRHLSENYFDVILSLYGSESIWFDEKFASYEAAEEYAQKEYRLRMSPVI